MRNKEMTEEDEWRTIGLMEGRRDEDDPPPPPNELTGMEDGGMKNQEIKATR